MVGPAAMMSYIIIRKKVRTILGEIWVISVRWANQNIKTMTTTDWQIGLSGIYLLFFYNRYYIYMYTQKLAPKTVGNLITAYIYSSTGNPTSSYIYSSTGNLTSYIYSSTGNLTSLYIYSSNSPWLLKVKCL